MSVSPRLPDEPDQWSLYIYESQAISLLHSEYGIQPEFIELIRLYGATEIMCDDPDPRRKHDFLVTTGREGESWRIVPKEPAEEWAIEILRWVKGVRDSIRASDPYGASSQAWQFGNDAARVFFEMRYQRRTKSKREVRDETLMTQIQYWLDEDPEVSGAEMVRRFRTDPRYADMVGDIKNLPMFLTRLRRRMNQE
jgi:hypothetical protein